MTLRNSNHIKLTNVTKSCSQNSLFYKGVHMFNALPNNIKCVATLNEFKSILYKFTTENL